MALPDKVSQKVSTHSRLKAAGRLKTVRQQSIQGFNTQPPEGGWIRSDYALAKRWVSTHSRLKAAGVGDYWQWCL